MEITIKELKMDLASIDGLTDHSTSVTGLTMRSTVSDATNG